MLQWYEEVGARLAHDAEVQEQQHHQERARQQQRRTSYMGNADPDDADSDTDEESANERIAANYFRNPFYKDGQGKPRIVRRFSRQKDGIYERGKGLVHGVRHFISGTSPTETRGGRYAGRGGSPSGGRRRSYPERREDRNNMVDYRPDEEVTTPGTLHPGYVPRATREAAARQHQQQQQAAAQRQARPPADDISSSESESTLSDESPRTSRRPSDANNAPPNIGVTPPGATRPQLHQRRSDEPPLASPRDYFPPQYPAHGRRHSAHAHSPVNPASPGSNAGSISSGFGPSESPLFATQVAQTHKHAQNLRSPSPRGGRNTQSPHIPLRGPPPPGAGRDPRDARDPRDPRDWRDRDARERYSDRERERNPRERPTMSQRRSSSDQRHSHLRRPGQPFSPVQQMRYDSRGPGPGAASGPEMSEAYRVQSELQRSARERERDRRRSRSQGYEDESRSRERDRDRERDIRERERERSARDREREKDRDSDRDGRRGSGPPRPKLPRHVTPVDGVGGRKYVSPVWGNRFQPPSQA